MAGGNTNGELDPRPSAGTSWPPTSFRLRGGAKEAAIFMLGAKGRESEDRGSPFYFTNLKARRKKKAL